MDSRLRKWVGGGIVKLRQQHFVRVFAMSALVACGLFHLNQMSHIE